MYIIGIDYSLTCPCICIGSRENSKFSDCQFFYLTSKSKKIVIDKDNIHGVYNDYNYKDNIDRFEFISDFFCNIINKYDADKIGIEGYSYASKGLVFNIAENCYSLKRKIIVELNKELIIFPPTVIKKMATG